MLSINYSTKTRHIRINSVTAKKNGSTSGGVVPDIVETPTGLTIGEGYGIITEDGRICIYVEGTVYENSLLPAIYLMFRRKI